MKIINHDKIKLEISAYLFEEVNKLQLNITIDEIYNNISTTPDVNLGQYTYPCFSISRNLKKSPNIISIELKEILQPNDKIIKIQAVGPYLNLFLSELYLGTLIGDEITNGTFFNRNLIDAPEKTMIEYSQPNTHKELHVGHMRNLCLGDSIIKLHRYCGYDIISSTFPGDVGTHVAKCLWYLKFYNSELIPTENKGAWLGTLYTKGHLKLESEIGTDKESLNKEQLSEILSQLENQKGDFFDLWKETREWSINLMNQVYDWANVKFDKWYWESEVDLPSVEYIKNNLNNGIFIKSENAIGVDLSDFDLGFCLLLKSDGHGLYATKDVELARLKFEDFKIEKSIYIVDKRQAHHFAQVFKVLELLGFENAKKCYHLEYDYVELPDGAMSSRKGNIVPIMDLIEQMKQTIKLNYLQKHIGDWNEIEIEKTTDLIAKGAIKYGMIKIDPNKKIVFDMNEWLKIDGDSGTYLLYTYARINSLYKKLSIEITEKPDWSLINETTEIELLLKLNDFNDLIIKSCIEYKPNLLCNYLYDLCKLYNSFYNQFSIKNTESQKLKSTRLNLSHSVGIILKKGLQILNIETVERM